MDIPNYRSNSARFTTRTKFTAQRPCYKTHLTIESMCIAKLIGWAFHLAWDWRRRVSHFIEGPPPPPPRLAGDGDRKISLVEVKKSTLPFPYRRLLFPLFELGILSAATARICQNLRFRGGSCESKKPSHVRGSRKLSKDKGRTGSRPFVTKSISPTVLQTGYNWLYRFSRCRRANRLLAQLPNCDWGSTFGLKIL